MAFLAVEFAKIIRTAVYEESKEDEIRVRYVRECVCVEEKACGRRRAGDCTDSGG